MFLQLLHSAQGLRGPFLVVAPLSTLPQWQKEISSWTTLDCIIYHGSQEDRFGLIEIITTKFRLITTFIF